MENQNPQEKAPEALQRSEAIGKTAPSILYPDPSTVKGRTLGAMLHGARLSHLDVWYRFGSARAAHHVYMLRKAEWDVRMDEETVTTSDAGRPATIGIYYLSPETIKQAGEIGQQYAEECARIEAERRAA